MFILGFPHDNLETMDETINYAKKLNTTYSLFNVWTPYPGTPVFNEYKEKLQKLLTKHSTATIPWFLNMIIFSEKKYREIFVKSIYKILFKFQMVI